jgi:hypothetical protein
MATTRRFTAEEQRKLVAELEVPLDPAMVEWKVVRRARLGRRGAVLPFAEPRAYTDRGLIRLFNRSCSSETVGLVLSGEPEPLFPARCLQHGADTT